MTVAGQERYEQLSREHRWEVPDRYNIAADVCDRHPADALAMIPTDVTAVRAGERVSIEPLSLPVGALA